MSDAPETGDVAQSAPPTAPAHKQRSFFYDFSFILMGKGMHIAIFAAVGIASARLWGAEMVGLLAAVMVLPGLLNTIADMGLSKALPYIIGKKIAPLDQVVGTALVLWLVASALSIGISLVYFVSPAAKEVPWHWIWLTLACSPLMLFSAIARGFCLGVRRVDFLTKQLMLVDPIVIGVILIGGIGLGFNAPEDAWIRILALVLANAAGMIYGLAMIASMTRLHFAWNPLVMARVLSHGIVFGMGILMMRLNYRIDILILSLAFFAVPDSDLGNYSMGVALAQILWEIPIAFGHILFSRAVTSNDDRGASLRAARVARVGMMAALPFAVGLFVVAPWVIPLIYGSEFDKAAGVVRILIPGILVFFTAQAFESDLTAKGRPMVVVSVMGPTALANVVLNVLLIPRYGIDGAAFASTVTYTLGAMALAVVYARVSGLGLREVVVPRRSDLDPILGRLRKKRPVRSDQRSR